jgi:parvulin-like peptidyl-prolyl isomerase
MEVYAKQEGVVPYQDRYTRLCLLFFPLADELVAYAAARFVEEQVSNLNGVVDEIRLQELYNQISHLAGEAMMEELNLRLKQRFLIAPLAAVFAQGLTDDLLNRLISRDQETSKQMFQLLLDSLSDTP